MNNAKVNDIKRKAQENKKPKVIKKTDKDKALEIIDEIEEREASQADTKKPEPTKLTLNDHLKKASEIKSPFEKEAYLQTLVSEFGVGMRVVKAELKVFEESMKQNSQVDKVDKFAENLQQTFNLHYKPFVNFDYSERLGNLIYDEELTLCHLFVPYSKISADINGKERYFLKILHKENSTINEIIEPARDFSKSDRINAMFGDSAGVVLDSQKTSKVVRYISDFLIDNKLKIKQETGRLHTGWKNGTYYIPLREQNVVWLDTNLEKSFVKKGTRESQLDFMSELTKGKMFISVLGSFASCLFGVVNPMSFMIHLGGLSGKGKSTANKCALSFFGNFDRLKQNWNSTLNGLESYWETQQASPVCVDEMELAKSIDDIVIGIYSFTNDQGRLRAFVKDDEIRQRETKTYSGVCLTSGEKSIAEIQNMVTGRNKPKGLTRRVIDINARDIWDGINFEKVESMLKQNSGLLGLEFIEYVERNQKAIASDFESNISFFNGLATGDKATQFGLLKLTLEILFKIGLINQYAYDMQLANLKLFATQEEQRAVNIKDTYTEFKDSFTQYIMANLSHFDIVNEFGNINDCEKEPRYGRVNMLTNEISIFTVTLQTWCHENAFVKNQVLEAVEEKGKLSANKGRHDKTVSFGQSKIKCFQFVGLFEKDLEKIETVYETISQATQKPQNIDIPAPIDPSLFDNQAETDEIPF